MNNPWASFLVSSVAWQGVRHSEAIAEVREAGFGGVEILCKPGHFECDNADHVREVRTALALWPEAIVTFHAPFYDLYLASGDCDMEYALRAMEVGRKLGAEVMTVHARTIKEMGDWDTDAFDTFRRNLGLLMGGIRIAVENLPPPHFTSHEDDLFRLLDGFPNVGFCLDTGHAHLGGRSVEVTGALAHRASVVHLHDNAGEGDKHLLPGQGTIPWKDVVQALGGFRGRLVIESVYIEDFEILKKGLMETGLCKLA